MPFRTEPTPPILRRAAPAFLLRAAPAPLLCAALAIFLAVPAAATLGATFSIAELTGSAERIFRGRCTAAVPVTADFKGTPIAATAYTFQIAEYLKGDGPRLLTFRQVGTPERGASDLGRVGGLTVFAPGVEYLVFLRPVSKAGLTSAAGRGQGVLIVSGETAQLADPDGRSPVAGTERLPYPALRAAILRVTRASR